MTPPSAARVAAQNLVGVTLTVAAREPCQHLPEPGTLPTLLCSDTIEDYLVESLTRGLDAYAQARDQQIRQLNIDVETLTKNMATHATERERAVWEAAAQISKEMRTIPSGTTINTRELWRNEMASDLEMIFHKRATMKREAGAVQREEIERLKRKEKGSMT